MVWYPIQIKKCIQISNSGGIEGASLFSSRNIPEENISESDEEIENKTNTSVEEDAPIYTSEELTAMTVSQLKALADELGVEYTSSVKKQELIDSILAYQQSN